MARPSSALELSWNLFGHQLTKDEPHTLDYIFDYMGKERINYNVVDEPLLRVPREQLTAILNGDFSNWTPTKDCIISSHKATVRREEGIDTTLGVVGNDYQIVQNQVGFEFINFIQEVSGIAPKIETFGSLGNGERMFICATLGEDMFLNPNDAVKNYLVFSNSHDGKSGVMCFMTPVRIICKNSLVFAMQHATNKVVFKHTKNVNERVDFTNNENRHKALEVFAKSVDFSKEFLDKMNQLKSYKVNGEFTKDFAHHVMLSDEQYKLYLKANRSIEHVDEISTRAKNQVIGLMDAIENGIGQRGFESDGTRQWLLNGITTYFQNDVNYKSDEAKFTSLMDGGTNQKRVQKAYNLLIAA